MAAIGHTDADYDTCRAAIDAGATGATHLFNAMAPLRHREPGPVLALWEDLRVVLALIMDGVHVRPELVAFVMASEPDRVVLVTDAMAAAASADGDYVLGELPVEVRDGVARIAGKHNRRSTSPGPCCSQRGPVGVLLAQAVRATASPADYLGLPKSAASPLESAPTWGTDDALAPSAYCIAVVAAQRRLSRALSNPRRRSDGSDARAVGPAATV